MSLLLPNLIYAGKPIFIIKAINKPAPIVINNEPTRVTFKIINNTPMLLTNNGLANKLSNITQITDKPGSCGQVFSLNPGQSCNLILAINDSSFTSEIEIAPKICHNLEHPVYCSLPSPQNIIHLRKIPEIAQILNKAIYKNAKWGLRVVNQNTGEVLINLKPAYLFFIGSVRKIFSVGEYLLQVGESFRFVTPVSYSGTLNNGLLNGDLILTASGDLTMGGRNLPNGQIAYTNFDHNEANSLGNAILTTPNPLAGYKELAKKVYDFGIRRVTGEVIIDDRLFVPFNFRNEFDVKPIFVNDDVIDVAMLPSNVDFPALVDWRPKSQALTVSSTLQTTAPRTQATYNLVPELPSCIGTTPCEGLVAGNLPIDFVPPLTNAYPLIQTFRIVEPANYARTVFIEALKEAGVVIDASPVTQNPSPPAGTYIPITQLLSLPFSEYAKYILKVSYNIGADTSLVLFGLTQGVNNMADALVIERNLLINKFGIPGSQFFFVDGSGGGNTKASLIAVTQWLAIMRYSPVYQAFFDALPILGVDGSLATIKDFQSNPSLQGATGNIRAKTGTYVVPATASTFLLRGEAFAGYIHTQAGHNLNYQLVVNNVVINSIDELISIIQDMGIISAILWRDL